jgi:hypothetical protein
MPCSVAIEAFDAKDMLAVRDVGAYIENAMQALDLHHTDEGEPGIWAQMSDHARGEAAGAAIGFCRQHPRSTTYNQAADAYDGLRGIELMLGGAK